MKIPVGVPCSRLGDEDDPCTGRKTLYLMRFETETARTARDEVVDSRADILGGFEKQVGSWINNREAKKSMTLCKTLAHVMILPEIPRFRGPMDRLKRTSFLKIVILAPLS
jgi:hypothetical protein